MTTMNDVVTGALTMLRVINPRQAVSGYDASNGLTVLNDMMHSWKGQGVDTDHDTLDAADDFPLDDEHVQATKALLAEQLAPYYGVTASNEVLLIARMGWQGIQAEYVTPAPDATYDTGLTELMLGRWWTTN